MRTNKDYEELIEIVNHSRKSFRKTIMKVLRDTLISYLTFKNEIIKAQTDIDYIDEADIEEVKSWPDNTIITILRNFEPGCDLDICPWCIILQKEKCSKCTYGKRNGLCAGDYKSKYNRIMRSFINKGILKPGPAIGMCDFDKIEKLSRYTQNIFKILLESFKDYLPE